MVVWRDGGNWLAVFELDQMVRLALRLGTDYCVYPYYTPVASARGHATLDCGGSDQPESRVVSQNPCNPRGILQLMSSRLASVTRCLWRMRQMSSSECHALLNILVDSLWSIAWAYLKCLWTMRSSTWFMF
eukprot:scaffold216137_cov17-Tisochrysis_lutea.AAC.1